MKFYQKGSFWYSACLVVIPVLIIAGALHYSKEAKLVPWMVGIVTLILGVIVLTGEIFPSLGGIFEMDLFKVGTETLEKSTSPAKASDPGSINKMLGGFVLMIGFFILIWLVGFLLAVPLYVFLSLKLLGRLRWLRSALITLTVWGFVYMVFEYAMSLHLFRGILFGEIAPSF